MSLRRSATSIMIGATLAMTGCTSDNLSPAEKAVVKRVDDTWNESTEEARDTFCDDFTANGGANWYANEIRRTSDEMSKISDELVDKEQRAHADLIAQRFADKCAQRSG